MESAITSKGQATIPKAIREHLHVGPGDRIRFFIHPSGDVVILRRRPVSDLRGMFNWTGPTVTLEQMDEAIAEGAAERDRLGKAR